MTWCNFSVERQKFPQLNRFVKKREWPANGTERHSARTLGPRSLLRSGRSLLTFLRLRRRSLLLDQMAGGIAMPPCQDVKGDDGGDGGRQYGQERSCRSGIHVHGCPELRGRLIKR